MLAKRLSTGAMLAMLACCGLMVTGCPFVDQPCTSDAACDDGVYCNGAETCDLETGLCLEGADPCPGQMCIEEGNLCVDCLTDADCAEGEICTDDGECLAETIDGAALYAADCALCHGEDGAGPPDIIGFTAEELTTGLESATHGAIDLTAEEVAAIAEFLAG